MNRTPQSKRRNLLLLGIAAGAVPLATHPAAMVGESIAAGGAMYVLSHGKWIKRPVSLAEMNAERDEHDWTKDTCTHLRDESVNGEAASDWRTHVVTEVSTVDTDMWISKSRGLVLKANSVMDVGTGDKNHTSARYDYSNVKAPAGVQ